ncbi:MAG: phosphotransferase [Microthrixaceae bacterium]
MNPLPESVRSLLRAAGIDEQQVLATDPVAADSGDYLMDPQLSVELLADALRALHSVDPTPAAAEPMSLAQLLERASAVAAQPSPPELDPAYAHMERSRLLEVLAQGAQDLGEFPDSMLVITHGSASPATLRCAGAQAIGFADWQRAAVADPHRDLAFAAAAVASHLGPMLVPVLMERYGVRPDPRRLDWWVLGQQLTGTAGAQAAGRA